MQYLVPSLPEGRMHHSIGIILKKHLVPSPTHLGDVTGHDFAWSEVNFHDLLGDGHRWIHETIGHQIW